nr:hypothetical protein CFP56_11745 [Quercus suber]
MTKTIAALLFRSHILDHESSDGSIQLHSLLFMRLSLRTGRSTADPHIVKPSSQKSDVVSSTCKAEGKLETIEKQHRASSRSPCLLGGRIAWRVWLSFRKVDEDAGGGDRGNGERKRECSAMARDEGKKYFAE